MVGACALVWRRQSVRGLPVRRVYLNCAGEDESLYLEYNFVPARPGYEARVAAAAAEYLKQRRWDELVMPGMVAGAAMRGAAAPLGREDTKEHICRYVDLARLRREGADFDAVLSSNTRQQIRRSLRLYEEAHGPCAARPARTAEEAVAMCGELAELHTSAWNERGQKGAFHFPRFRAFHERLILATFPMGGAQLVRVEAGGETLGILYYFIHRGRVSFYQSGFRYSSDNRLKPGLLAHYLAIRHFLQDATAEEYDFLAGDSQYKRSLATSERTLYWTWLRRTTIPTLLYYGLKSLKDTYAQLAAKRSERAEPPVRPGE